jgi:Zn-dependent M28 family amino/carboxypeptidase
LKAAGLEVIEQKTKVLAFDKKEIPVRNLIAQINPGAKVRYLLSAHWDARPFADEDPDPKNRLKPVPAVNDGGSGVVVLLGIADALKGRKIPFGVDLVFLDAEDGGKPANELSYCLGTQYFAKNPIPAGYQARFGINFDMVGRIGATFPIEAYSLNRAGAVVSKIRAAAKGLGYQDYFPEYRVGPIIDDHLYLMEGLGFPVVDLIHMTEDNHFPPEWHTVKDTSEVISRTTLKVVGWTTLKVLWDEE